MSGSQEVVGSSPTSSKYFYFTSGKELTERHFKLDISDTIKPEDGEISTKPK